MCLWGQSVFLCLFCEATRAALAELHQPQEWSEITHKHCDVCGADSQHVEWHEANVRQVSEEAFAAEPVAGLCHFCGEAIEVLSLTEDMTREEVVQRAMEDRVFKAKLLLLQHVKEGKVPKGFQCSVVKTTHTVGQQTNVACRAVRTSHFSSHEDLFMMEPSSLPGSKIEQKPYQILNGELGVDQVVSMADDGTIPSSLPSTAVTMYHKTETQLVEFHLQPEFQLSREQAMAVFKRETRNAVDQRAAAMRLSHIYTPWSYSKWQEMCKKADDDRKKEDKKKEEVAKEFGRPQAANEFQVSRHQGATNLLAQLAPPPKRGTGSGAGGFGRQSGQAAPSRKQPRFAAGVLGGSPRAEPAMKKEVPGPSGQRRLKAEQSPPASTGDEDSCVLDLDAKGKAARDKRSTEWHRGGGPKEINVEFCLTDPDGGSIGRTVEPVLALAHLVRQSHTLV